LAFLPSSQPLLFFVLFGLIRSNACASADIGLDNSDLSLFCITAAGTACSLEATRNAALALSTRIYSFFFVTRWRRDRSKRGGVIQLIVDVPGRRHRVNMFAPEYPLFDFTKW